MIIKIDHIAYSSLDIEFDIEKFKNIGYKLAFQEKQLENLFIKKQFINNFKNTHELALMTKNSSYNVELLNHNNINNCDGFINPLNLKATNFDKIVINTNNVGDSVAFWRLLGFSPTAMVDNMQEMIFSSPLATNDFFIYLNYNENTERNLLDDNNFSCIALITTSAKRERENILKNGFFTSEIEELEVNAQKLKIFFTQRDNGEIIEIIEIVRKK